MSTGAYAILVCENCLLSPQRSYDLLLSLMGTYSFFDTDSGVDPVNLSRKLFPSPEATLAELASYVVTDWQPYGFRSSAAVEIVEQFIGLIAEDSSSEWIMRRQSAILSRGWKGMISEAVGVAFSRQSASLTKGYNFCVHLDHFLKGGLFHRSDFSVEKKSGSERRFRPDYLVASRKFQLRGTSQVFRYVCSSMEVKGKAVSILGTVPASQKAQSENIRLFRVRRDSRRWERTPINLLQNLLSMVRANCSLETPEPRKICVRHSNYYYYCYDERNRSWGSELFVRVVLAHYLQTIDRLLDRKETDSCRKFFNAFCRKSHNKDAGMKILERLDDERGANASNGLVFISPQLSEFFGSLFTGQLVGELNESLDFKPLAKHLKRIEAKATAFPAEKMFCRADGFMFDFGQ